MTEKSSNHKGREQERNKGMKESQTAWKKISKMAVVSTYLPIITLNKNGLSSLIKRQSGWKKNKNKNDPTMCYVQETPSALKTHTEWKLRNGKIYTMQMATKGKQG